MSILSLPIQLPPSAWIKTFLTLSMSYRSYMAAVTFSMNASLLIPKPWKCMGFIVLCRILSEISIPSVTVTRGTSVPFLGRRWTWSSSANMWSSEGVSLTLSISVAGAFMDKTLLFTVWRLTISPVTEAAFCMDMEAAYCTKSAQSSFDSLSYGSIPIRWSTR